MFNGMTVATTGTAFTGFQNAIYRGETISGEDTKFNFVTQSLVEKGNAVLVYPADTTFFNKKNEGVYITVPTKQDKTTKLLQTYVSDVMDIDSYDSNGKDNTAGYGRNYDAPMKKVGSLFSLALDAKGKDKINNIADVASIEFEDVELSSTSSVFNNIIKLVAGTASTLNSEFDHITLQTEVDFANKTYQKKFSTSDVDNDIAYFTLLPHANNVVVEGAAITVYTTYGKVVIANNAEETPIVNAGGDKFTVKAALETILRNTWIENTTAASAFKGAKTGGSFKRTISFDLANLDMNNTKVKTSKQLIDLLKVYQALEKTGSLTLVLDGADGEFIMTEEALDKLIEVKTVTLDNSSNAIVIENGSNLTKLNNEYVKTTENINLILTGVWTLDQKEKFTKLNSLVNKGALTVTNTTSLGADKKFGIALSNKGEFAVTDKVYMGEVTADAKSTINIKSNYTYYAAGKTVLAGTVNVETLATLASYDATDGILNTGVINNAGELSVVEEKQAKFYNVGTINNKGDYCITYLTENEYTIDSKSYKGAIVLNKRNDEVSIKNSGKGYIKYAMTATEDGLTVDSKPADKFNYLIINVDAPVKNIADVNIASMTANYLEINGKTANVTSNVTKELKTLLVNSSMRYLSSNKDLTVTDVWVADYILHGGNLKVATENINKNNGEYNSGIFGAEDDKYSGEVRTTGAGAM